MKRVGVTPLHSLQNKVRRPLVFFISFDRSLFIFLPLRPWFWTDPYWTFIFRQTWPLLTQIITAIPSKVYPMYRCLSFYFSSKHRNSYIRIEWMASEWEDKRFEERNVFLQNRLLTDSTSREQKFTLNLIFFF